MLAGNDEVAWQPPQYKKRMDDWLRNMSDWNISRRRYFGLPLPFYPCGCGRLNVVGSRAEVAERAASGVPQPLDPHRPTVVTASVRCVGCLAEVTLAAEGWVVLSEGGIFQLSRLSP